MRVCQPGPVAFHRAVFRAAGATRWLCARCRFSVDRVVAATSRPPQPHEARQRLHSPVGLARTATWTTQGSPAWRGWPPISSSYLFHLTTARPPQTDYVHRPGTRREHHCVQRPSMNRVPGIFARHSPGADPRRSGQRPIRNPRRSQRICRDRGNCGRSSRVEADLAMHCISVYTLFQCRGGPPCGAPGHRWRFAEAPGRCAADNGRVSAETSGRPSPGESAGDLHMRASPTCAEKRKGRHRKGAAPIRSAVLASGDLGLA